jgi:hypothetical protein
VTKRVQLFIAWAFPVALFGLAVWIYPKQRVSIVVAGIALAGVIAALTLLWKVAWAARGNRSLASLLRPRPRREPRPDDLERLERIFGWKVYSGGDFDFRVKPVLRSILRARLLEKQNIDVDDSPERARAAISPALAPLLSDGLDENERFETKDLEAMVRDMEAI